LFVCHWKSKSGGEEESEIWRDLQESLLTSCILNADNKQIVACGDFNRELTEFKINKISNKVVLRNFNPEEQDFLELNNPWLLSNENGSYVYNEEWNKIDHFFLSENVSFLSFSTISDYTDENGYPIKYSVRTGKGYSDHLPIMCQLSF
jgi:endonuclease/exonuclease/phosphatase family metal-dependent hydrolase